MLGPVGNTGLEIDIAVLCARQLQVGVLWRVLFRSMIAWQESRPRRGLLILQYIWRAVGHRKKNCDSLVVVRGGSASISASTNGSDPLEPGSIPGRT